MRDLEPNDEPPDDDERCGACDEYEEGCCCPRWDNLGDGYDDELDIDPDAEVEWESPI